MIRVIGVRARTPWVEHRERSIDVMTTNAVSSSAISISPNPFSPDGDGYEDFCINPLQSIDDDFNYKYPNL